MGLIDLGVKGLTMREIERRKIWARVNKLREQFNGISVGVFPAEELSALLKLLGVTRSTVSHEILLPTEEEFKLLEARADALGLPKKK